MELLIFADRVVGDVHVGDVVQHARGPLVVDEVRHTMHGVDVYGRAEDVHQGPRRKLSLGHDDRLHVLPSPSTAWAVWRAVAEAATADPDQDDALRRLDPDGPGPKPEATINYSGVSWQLVVKLGVDMWFVAVELPEEPPREPYSSIKE